MADDLLHALETKVAHALEVIAVLRLQVSALEEENSMLRVDHDQWRDNLKQVMKHFDVAQQEVPVQETV